MTKKSSLGHLPEQEKWIFDDSVTDCFEDMLKRSIPFYPEMRKAVNNLVRKFHVHGTEIIDLGSSRGDAVYDLIQDPEIKAKYVLAEVSKPMIEVLQKRFQDNKDVQIYTEDIRNKFPYGNASVTLSILTLQFIPIEYRQEIIQNIYNNLYYGGIFILVEKVLGNTHILNKTFVESYYDMKKENGYSQDEIQRKKLALEGVLVPVTSKWNEDLLKQAGFRQIDIFYKMLNFSGWIAIK